MEKLLILLIPGFIFLKVSKLDKPLQKKEQWPFLFDVAISSLTFCRLVASILTLCAKIAMPAVWTLSKVNVLIEYLCKNRWLKVFGYLPSIISRLVSHMVSKMKLIYLYFKDYQHPEEELSEYTKQISKLVDKKSICMVELVNGKMYVAKMISASLGKKEEEMVLVLAPYLSGCRKESQVVFDTHYPANFDTISAVSQEQPSDEDANGIKIIIPYRHIQTVREFDHSFFIECYNAKIISFAESIKNFTEKANVPEKRSNNHKIQLPETDKQ